MKLLLGVVLLWSSVSCGHVAGSLWVRITPSAFSVLRDYAVSFLQSIKGRPIELEMNVPRVENLTVKTITLLEFIEDPHQVTLNLLEDGGVQLVLDNALIQLKVKTEGKFSVTNQTREREPLTNLSGKIKTKLSSTKQGHLTVEITGCTLKLQNLRITGGWWTDTFIKHFLNLLASRLCKMYKSRISNTINEKLAKLVMQHPVFSIQNQSFLLDYSLITPPSVSSSHLDIQIKAWLRHEADTEESVRHQLHSGPVPVFPNTSKMVYVAVTDSAFQSAALALQRIMNLLLTGYHVRAQAEKPLIHIKKDGLQVIAGVNLPSPRVLKCDLQLKVEIQKSLLILSSQHFQVWLWDRNVRKPFGFTPSGDQNGKELLWNGVKFQIKSDFKGLFGGGFPVPLSQGLFVENVSTEYHEGYILFSGDLSTAQGQQ